MVLARAWRRRLYASMGLAVIVPAALLISLGLLAVNGGIPSLSVLGQALSGPSAPSAAAPALGGGVSGTAKTSAALATVAGARSAAPRTRVGSAVGIPAAPPAGSVPRSVTPSQATPIAPSGSTHVPSGSGSDQSSGGGLSGVSSPPHHSTSPPPAHHSPPTAIDRVVNKVTPITSKLPAPAGPVVTGVVKKAGGLADRLLKPRHL